ncbi:hypothetical protein C7T35_31265 [Variovorax sp. WS11]|nr:hypothetical protein C7T35_31265 [Variovorax sp. WS11]
MLWGWEAPFDGFGNSDFNLPDFDSLGIGNLIESVHNTAAPGAPRSFAALGVHHAEMLQEGAATPPVVSSGRVATDSAPAMPALDFLAGLWGLPRAGKSDNIRQLFRQCKSVDEVLILVCNPVGSHGGGGGVRVGSIVCIARLLKNGAKEEFVVLLLKKLPPPTSLNAKDYVDTIAKSLPKDFPESLLDYRDVILDGALPVIESYPELRERVRDYARVAAKDPSRTRDTVEMLPLTGGERSGAHSRLLLDIHAAGLKIRASAL